MRKKQEKWMLEELRKSYATTATPELADLFGVTDTTVFNWARQLGLKKDPQWLLDFHRKQAATMRVLSHTTPVRKHDWHASTEWKKGHSYDVSKAVIRLDTLQVYPSAAEAGRQIGYDHRNIGRSCRGQFKCAGTRWMFLEQYKRFQERKNNEPQWKRNRI